MDVSSKHPNEFGVLLIDSNNLPRSTWEAVGGVDSGGYIATADIILPYCSATVIVDCLESVAIYKNGSPATSAVFQGQAAGVTPLSKLDKGLPQAGEANLFSADPQSGITGTQNFSIKVIKRLKFSNLTKKYEHYNLTIFAQPYEVERAKSFKSTSSYDPLKYAWFGDGEAGLIKDFSKDTRVSVTVRMPKDSGGWFSGRLSDPLVQLKSEVNYNSLTVDALPTTVQRIQAWVPMNKKIPALTKMGINNPGDYLALESGYDEPYNPTSLDFTDQLRPFVGDKSTAEETVWVVRSTFIKNPCFPNNRISGFVTTNAMAYSWNPPVLKNGFLDYRVGGMHTTSTGELTKGTYDLVLNSETARCLYKFSSAPISATVSILGASGETQSVETTVLTERDGFLKLSAYGFTFSSPVVRVKLAQKKSATDSKNLKTIVCVKGSAIKKVTAVKPVCPSGFKVK
jgi:hypothetical protein